MTAYCLRTLSLVFDRHSLPTICKYTNVLSTICNYMNVVSTICDYMNVIISHHNTNRHMAHNRNKMLMMRMVEGDMLGSE